MPNLPSKTHLSPIKSPPADYSVVLITNDSSSLIQSFIRVQTFLGASQLLVYLDRDFDESEFGSFENVTFLSVKDVFSTGERPKRFYSVQGDVYQHAYKMCTTTWLAVMDTDECIFHPDLPMNSFLKGIPPHTEFIPARSHDVFWGNFSAAQFDFSNQFCRTPASAMLLDRERLQLFGGSWKYTTRWATTGHVVGKYLVRTGLDMDLNVHLAYHESGRMRIDHAPSLGLLHFESRSFSSWHKRFGAGKPSGGGAHHDPIKRKRALIKDINPRLYHATNVRIFKDLYCWSKKKRLRYLEFGDIFSMSWKWEILWKIGTLSPNEVLGYYGKNKVGRRKEIAAAVGMPRLVRFKRIKRLWRRLVQRKKVK